MRSTYDKITYTCTRIPYVARYRKRCRSCAPCTRPSAKYEFY